MVKYEAGSHDGQGNESNSSYINLRDVSSKDMPRNVSKTSTTVTHEDYTKPSESDFPVEGIVVSNTFERSDDMV